MLVGDGGACLLVDPGVTTSELAGLAAELEARGLRPVGRWATHGHWDHLLTTAAWAGVPASWGGSADERPPGPATSLAPAPVVVDGGARTWHDAVVAERDADPELAAVAPGDRPEVLAGPPSRPATGPSPTALGWPGPRTVVVPTPGHAAGHASLWLPGPRVLVAGDLLSDSEVPLLGPVAHDALAVYRATLDALEALGAHVVVPGHGTVARGAQVAARLAADRAYLDDLAAGRESADSRLATPWLATEHARQRAELGF